MPPTPRRTTAALLATFVALGGAGCDRAADRSGTAGAGSSAGTTAGGGAVVVQMRGLRFEPAEVTVGVGQPVTWRDAEDVAHTVTTGRYTVGADGLRTSEAKDGKVDKRVDGAGTTVTYAFGAPGRYQYLCTYHPGMNGVVAVR